LADSTSPVGQTQCCAIPPHSKDTFALRSRFNPYRPFGEKSVPGKNIANFLKYSDLRRNNRGIDSLVPILASDSNEDGLLEARGIIMIDPKADPVVLSTCQL